MSNLSRGEEPRTLDDQDLDVVVPPDQSGRKGIVFFVLTQIKKAQLFFNWMVLLDIKVAPNVFAEMVRIKTNWYEYDWALFLLFGILAYLISAIGWPLLGSLFAAVLKIKFDTELN